MGKHTSRAKRQVRMQTQYTNRRWRAGKLLGGAIRKRMQHRTVDLTGRKGEQREG